MALRQGARALARLAPACDGLWQLQALQALPACAQAQVAWWQTQHLSSYTQSQGFAASATAQQAPAAVPAAMAAPAAALPDVYARLDARVDSQYSVQPKRVFAVVEVGGTQYKVTPNDVIVVEKLSGVDVNDTLQLQRVLLLGSTAETIIGRPYVPGSAVTAAVEEQFLDGKVLIFHKRRRKNSRRLRGHRQPLTTLRILDVTGIEEAEPPAAAAAVAGQ